ncbi:MAG: sulfotransferase [Anaerolineae bacterium]
MSDGRIKVLYIVGNGRSGSTLLNTVLGQLDGYFAMGELRRIWDRAILENFLCGCSRPFRECEQWRAIFDEAFGGMDEMLAARMAAHREAMTQTKHLPGLIWGRGRPLSQAAQAYVDTLATLYGAVQRVTGCQVMVDASKWPMYAIMLDRIPQLEMFYVHLVRDPRAVAFSWARVKEREPGVQIFRQGAFRSSMYWVTWNPAITHLWKGATEDTEITENSEKKRHYLFMRYEDFAREPRQWVQRMVDLVGAPVAELPFVDEQTLRLRQTHSVAGNEARLAKESLTIRFDDEWRRQIPAAKKWLVTAMTWPWLWRYGYWGRGK